MSDSRNASTLYFAWSEGHGKKKVSAYLTERLENEPEEVVALLNCQLPRYISSNEEGVHPDDYSRDTYDLANKYVDPETIAKALSKVYSSDVLEAGYVNMHHVRHNIDGCESVTVDEAAARQFMAIHRQAANEREAPDDKSDGGGENNSASATT